jgi:hypothetical protein
MIVLFRRFSSSEAATGRHGQFRLNGTETETETRTALVDRACGRSTRTARRDAEISCTRRGPSLTGWSDASIAKRYMHVPAEFLAAIADQVGGLVWADVDEEEQDGDPPAGVLAPTG